MEYIASVLQAVKTYDGKDYLDAPAEYLPIGTEPCTAVMNSHYRILPNCRQLLQYPFSPKKLL